jgi:hypothetical protein
MWHVVTRRPLTFLLQVFETKKTGAIGRIATGYSNGVAEVSVNTDTISLLAFSEKKKDPIVIEIIWHTPLYFPLTGSS